MRTLSVLLTFLLGALQTYPSPGPGRQARSIGTGNPLAASTTTLQASLASANTGQSVTLTAMVGSQSGANTPTGTVTFYSGSSSLGTAILGSTGRATFSTTTLPAGSDSITAFYSGDTNDAASTSPPTTVTITSTVVPTHTVLVTSATAIKSGQSVTFTAKVVSQSGKGVPAGSIKFFDGTKSMGKASLNANGAATLSTIALTTGIHSITASYFGDGEDRSSVSNVVSVVVMQNTNTSTHTFFR